MKKIVTIFSVALLSSCAHQGSKPKAKGELLNKARYEVIEDKPSKSSCTTTPSENTQELVEQISQCANGRQWTQVEKLGQVLAAKAHESGWGAYFLSLSAEHTEQPERALWMAELAIKKEPGRAVFYYQKARLLGQLGDDAGQAQALELGYSQEPDIEPFLLLTAKKSYAGGDCATLKQLNETRGLGKLATGAVLTAECLALDGQLEQARLLLDSFLKHSPGHSEVLLQRARIEETFAANFSGAASLYKKVQRSSNKPELLAWVKSKLEYLEGSQTLDNIKVSQKGDQ